MRAGVRIGGMVAALALLAFGVVVHAGAVVGGNGPTTDGAFVQASGSGAPWMRFQEMDVASSGRDEARGTTGGRPVSMVSLDVNGDGAPDVVAGYAGGSGGMLKVFPGNPASLSPAGPAARKGASVSPLLGSTVSVNVAVSPDFLAAGNVCPGGKAGVVLGSSGGSRLYFYALDGKGSLAPAGEADLGGTLTALASGDFNRKDGISSVAAGVNGSKGPQVAVFHGTLVGQALAMPQTVTALGMGRLGPGAFSDLAVACGDTLVVVQGRDGFLPMTAGATAPPVTTDSRSFGAGIVSLAVGRFTTANANSVALLLEDGSVQVVTPGYDKASVKESLSKQQALVPAKLATWGLDTKGSYADASQIMGAHVSSRPGGDDLVVVSPSGRRVYLIEGEKRQGSGPATEKLKLSDEPGAVLPMRLGASALDGLVVMKKSSGRPVVEVAASGTIFWVTDTGDSGPGTLRQAITDANANPGLDTIYFNIPAGSFAGTPVITPLSPLPQITDPVIIDGTSQWSYYWGGLGNGVVDIVGGYLDVVFDVTAGSTTITGLEIEGAGAAILFEVNGGNVASAIFTGSTPLLPAPRKEALISGNGIGVMVLDTPFNTIGGTTPDEACVISGNGVGVVIYGDKAVQNDVFGSFIGTDVSGQSPNGNYLAGVLVVLAETNEIGTASPPTRNVISGNGLFGNQPSSADIGNNLGMGVLILGAGLDTQAPSLPPLGSRPKTAHAPSMPSPQGFVAQLNGLRPGKTAFSFLGFDDGFAIGNVVAGNYIGTNLYGNIAVPNATEGVAVAASFYTTVGGGAPARNVISGNGDYGVATVGALGIKVQGNYIGPTADGESAIVYDSQAYYTGNFSGGVVFSDIWVSDGCPYTILPTIGEIGGTDPGEGNVISGNYGDGIDWFGTPFCLGVAPTASKGRGLGSRTESSFLYDAIVGNYIGTDASGGFGMGNWYDGVYVESSDEGVLIGGWDPTMRNVISGNGFYDYRKHGGQDKGGRGGQARAEDGYSGNGYGIEIDNDEYSGIFGNYIGTDKTGAYTTIPNAYGGIYIDYSYQTAVGSSGNITNPPPLGRGPARRETASSPLDNGGNLISGNYGDGIEVYSSYDISIFDNFIGTDVTGTQQGWGNDGEGVYMDYSGGLSAPQGSRGVRHQQSATAPAGWASPVKARTNTSVCAGANRPEGCGSYALDVEYNLISGNQDDGVELYDCEDAYVGNNFIGTDVTGTQALGNYEDGIEDGVGSSYGGYNTFEYNLISANCFEDGGAGIALWYDCYGYGVYDTIQYNLIGTDVTGLGDLGNGSDGIFSEDTINTFVFQNTIAFNHGTGVVEYDYCDYETNRDNQISQNSIFNNTTQGIYLYDGANQYIPHPDLNQAITNGVDTLVLGYWGPYNWTTGMLEFFTNDQCGPPSGDVAPQLAANHHGKEFVVSGYGQGKYYKTSDSSPATNGGNFASLMGMALNPGDILTATESGSGNFDAANKGVAPARKEDAYSAINTSQFSNCINVVACPTITVGLTGCGGAGVGLTSGQQYVLYGTVLNSSGSGSGSWGGISGGGAYTGGEWVWQNGSGPITTSWDGIGWFPGDLAFKANFAGGVGNIDDTPSWNGTDTLSSFGYTATSTYAQVITAPGAGTTTLTDFTLYLNVPASCTFQGGVGAWNGSNVTSILWQSTDTNTAGAGMQAVTFTLCDAFHGVVGTAYTGQTNVTGGQGPYIYSISDGSLPPGLSLDPVTGAITGTPTLGGDFTFTITAKDTNGGLIPNGFCFGTGTYTIHVAWPPIVCAGIISPATPIAATAGTPVTFSAGAVTGGDGGPYTYSWNLGGLPPNNLQTGSSVTQTYMANGTITVTLTVTDSHGNTCTDTAQLTVTGGGPYDMFFKDLYGRSTMCANSTTGAYVFNILTGLGAGFGYTGTAIVTTSLGGVVNLNTPVSDPNRVQLTWVVGADKANGTFANGSVPAKQVLDDITVSANTSAVCNPFAPTVPPPQK